MPVTIAAMGQAVLVAGTVTVNVPQIGPNDLVFLTNGKAGGALGDLSVGTITAGTSFVINSSSGTDTSTVNWVVLTLNT